MFLRHTGLAIRAGEVGFGRTAKWEKSEVAKNILLFFAVVVCFLAASVVAAEEVPVTAASVVVVGNEGDLIGSSIATGDFNGDGAIDVFLGAPGG